MTDLMTSQLVLSPDEWRGRRAAHGECVHPFTSAFRSRRARGVLHPVHDFLFTYYTLSTSKLEQWHPGLGVELESSRDSVMEEYLHSGAYIPTHRGFILAAHAVRPHHRAQLTWTKQLCSAVLHREPRFACHGLHEWAMVYRSPDIRHAYPLRLSVDEVATVVENATLCCSHFDAFRFFTPAAAPRNALPLSPESRITHEQGGCIHANMDLYKLAYKLLPLISSDLLRATFLLALDAREVDMRASPYDLAALGYDPIPIETAEGQAVYRREQQAIAARAARLREELSATALALLAALEPAEITVNA